MISWNSGFEKIPINEIELLSIKSISYFQRPTFPNLVSVLGLAVALWTSSIVLLISFCRDLRLVKCNNRKILHASFKTGSIFLSVKPKSWSRRSIFIQLLLLLLAEFSFVPNIWDFNNLQQASRRVWGFGCAGIWSKLDNSSTPSLNSWLSAETH